MPKGGPLAKPAAAEHRQSKRRRQRAEVEAHRDRVRQLVAASERHRKRNALLRARQQQQREEVRAGLRTHRFPSAKKQLVPLQPNGWSGTIENHHLINFDVVSRK